MRAVLQRDARAARERLRLGKALVAAVCAVLLAASIAGCSFGDAADDADSPSTGFSEGASDERVTEQGEPAAPDTEGETPVPAQGFAPHAESFTLSEVRADVTRATPHSYSGYVTINGGVFDACDKVMITATLEDDGIIFAGYSAVIDKPANGVATYFEIPAEGMPQHNSYYLDVIPWE